MKPEKFNYLIIEDAPDVCEGIIRRMQPFCNWQSIGYCTGITSALQKLKESLPQLIFLDWRINGGSGFEVLQEIQNIPNYQPFIIFNTGFYKENPEIPQQLLNSYKNQVDVYLFKPLWENFRNNLDAYLKDAEEKINASQGVKNIVWIEDESKTKHPVDLSKIICICQNIENERCRDFYLSNREKPLTIHLVWSKCYELLEEHQIDFFITKNRAHLVVKNFIEKFERPLVSLKYLQQKVTVVKESVRDFEKWLAE